MLATVVAASIGPVARALPAPHKPHHARPAIDPHEDVTGAIGPSKSPPRDVLPPKVDDDTLPEPFRLPIASRTRMHECGMEWQGLKLSGQTADATWREFATICLASKDALTPKLPR